MCPPASGSSVRTNSPRHGGEGRHPLNTISFESLRPEAHPKSFSSSFSPPPPILYSRAANPTFALRAGRSRVDLQSPKFLAGFDLAAGPFSRLRCTLDMQSEKMLGKARRLRSICCLVPVGTKDALPQTPVCPLPPQYSSACIGAVLRLIPNARLLACFSPLPGPKFASLAAALNFLRLHWVIIAVTVGFTARPHSRPLTSIYSTVMLELDWHSTLNFLASFPSLVSSTLQSLEQTRHPFDYSRRRYSLVPCGLQRATEASRAGVPQPEVGGVHCYATRTVSSRWPRLRVPPSFDAFW